MFHPSFYTVNGCLLSARSNMEAPSHNTKLMEEDELFPPLWWAGLIICHLLCFLVVVEFFCPLVAQESNQIKINTALLTCNNMSHNKSAQRADKKMVVLTKY